MSSADRAEKIRILIVEDNCVAQKMAKIILHSLDCEVDIAESGHAALKLFDENRYDLIFMDLGLPDKDGYNITADIRNKEKELELIEIPIIGLSVHANESSRLKAFKFGMNDYITKPMTQSNCKAILEKFSTFSYKSASG
jgi:two-component system aerobic respiration control sensor histidine kinase ArcB